MRELIDRATILAAFRLICAEALYTAKGRGMTPQELEAFIRRLEEAMIAAPVIASTEQGFKTCAHFPRGQGARGCRLLTELTCAVKGKCSFYAPLEDDERPDEKEDILPPPGFPENLRAARMARGLSATRLTAKIGISRQSVCKWERGEKTPSAESLATLSAFLGVSAEDLLKTEPSP